MEKNRVLSQSLSHSSSLFDAPGTEALVLQNKCGTERVNSIPSYAFSDGSGHVCARLCHH